MSSGRSRVAFRVVLSACVAYFVVRLGQELPRAYSSDEIAIIKPIADFGVRYVLLHGDPAMNPPLHVLLFGLLGNAATMPLLGRFFSAICALAAVGAAARAAYRSAGEDLTAGATAAAIVALNPMTTVAATTFGVYAWVVATLLLRFAVMEALLRERGGAPWPRRGVAWAAYLGLTALLPWLHYGAALLLFFEAPGLALAGREPRRLLAGHAVAAFFALPLLALVLPSHAQWAGPRGHLALITMLGGGLETLGVPLAGVTLAEAIAWKRLPAMRRALVAHAVALPLAFVTLGRVAQVRPAAALLSLPALALVLGCAAARGAAWARTAPAVRRTAFYAGASAFVLIAAVHEHHYGLVPRTLPRDPSDAVRSWARTRAASYARGDDRTLVGIVPAHDVSNVDYYLRDPSRAQAPPPCNGCSTHGGLVVMPCPSVHACQAPRIVVVDCERPPSPPSPGCSEAWRADCAVEWDCSGAAAP